MWGVRTHTKPHTTKTKETRREVQSRSKLMKKKKKKEKQMDKTEGGMLGEMANDMGKQPVMTAM